MKAMILPQFGDVSLFECREVEKPTLQPGHVLISVHATSVNPIDCKIRAGLVPSCAPTLPSALQADVAGIVEAIAPDVTNFKIGDPVYGCAGGVKGLHSGACAQYLLADAQLISAKPQNLTMREAAAVPLVALTAWEALFDRGKIQAQDRILIHGGTGGVGHLAVQLAKSTGAFVATTVSDDKDFAEAFSYGADACINYHKESVESYVERLTDGRGFSFLFDTVGGSNLTNSLAAAAYYGRIVTTVSRTQLDLTPMHNKGLSLQVVFILLPLVLNRGREQFGKTLAQITTLVESGQLKIKLDPRQFHFEQLSAAHAILEAGQANGKMVLENRWN